MGFRGDNRGVSALVGFLLVIAMVTVGYSIYQGKFIPEQNRQVEFQHSQQVQGQLLNLRDVFLRTGTSGVSQSITLTVGADYPQRSLGVNFAISGGRIQTEPANQNGPSNITFENVTAVDDEVNDYWDSGNQRTTLSFSTSDIVYEPTYTRYQNAPTTVYTNSVLFNQFDEANLSTTDQLLIQDNTITIIVIDGSLSKSKSGEQATIAVDTQALSVATNSISVENNATGRRITITVPTTIANTSAWNDASLEEQNTIHDVRTHGNFLTITLERSQQYTLRMMKIGVGQGATEPPVAYIVPVELPPRTVSVDTNHTAVVEVRDRFNNPENNITVDVSATGGSFANPNQNVSSNDGRVSFEYQAPSTTGDYTLEFNISSSGSPAEKIVTREITVESSSGGGGDSTGPTVSNIEINRSGFSSGDDLQQGEVIQLNATVSDRGRGGTDIVAAEWNRTSPDGSLVSGFSFSPTDGEFNQPKENVSDAGIDTSGWEPGLHELSLRGRDGNLNWGPESLFRINITGTGGGGGGGGGGVLERIVFVDGSGTLSVIETDNSVMNYSTSQIKATGPMRLDFDGDSNRELPYANNNQNLQLVDDNGNKQTLDSSGSVDQAHIGIGDWDDDGTNETVYSRNGNLYSAATSESSSQLQQSSGGGSPISILSVSGVADFNDDNSNNIIYVNSNNELAYHRGVTGNGRLQISSTGASVPQGNAIGRPADYDDDNTIEVPVFDDNTVTKGIRLIDSNGNDGTFDPSVDLSQAPMGAFDYVGDSTPEIIFVTNNGDLYYLNPDTGATGQVGSVTAQKSPTGAA